MTTAPRFQFDFDFYGMLVRFLAEQAWDEEVDETGLHFLLRAFLKSEPTAKQLRHVASGLAYRGRFEEAAEVRRRLDPFGGKPKSSKGRSKKKRRPEVLAQQAVEATPPGARADGAEAGRAKPAVPPPIFQLRGEDLPLHEQIPWSERRRELAEQVEASSLRAHDLHREQLRRTNERESLSHRAAEADVLLKEAQVARAMREFAEYAEELRDRREDRRWAREDRREDRAQRRARERAELARRERKLALEEQREERQRRSAQTAAVFKGVTAAVGLGFVVLKGLELYFERQDKGR